MEEFTKDPGGHKVAYPGGGVRYTDPGVGWHNEPGGGMGMYDPGAGRGYMKDPGTGI
ncbi:hypothetical protein ACS2MN_29610 [Bacillus cereus group sp. BceL062]|uniref:hypothetical protein n=1 Tax=Bacillus cereus group sp. BceL062 TaxID=3445166 RepID=UPI003F23F06C